MPVRGFQWSSRAFYFQEANLSWSQIGMLKLLLQGTTTGMMREIKNNSKIPLKACLL